MEDLNLSEFSSIRPHKHPERYYEAYVPKNNSISKLNRHTGLPHEHKREIARRLKNKIS